MSSINPTSANVVTPVTTAPSDAIMIKLAARPANTRTIEAMPRGAERKAAAWNALVDVASTSQQPFVQLAEQLKSNGVLEGYETLVSPNMLIIDPKSGRAKEAVAAFQALQGVKGMYDSSGAQLTPSAVAAGRQGVSTLSLIHI